MPCILIVDEEPTSIMDLEAELGAEFEVLSALNLHEAYAIIDERDADISAVVSELLLPSSPGIRQRPKRIWERVPDAARIVVTSQGNDNDQQTITGVYTIVNAHAVLTKPWQPGASVDT